MLLWSFGFFRGSEKLGRRTVNGRYGISSRSFFSACQMKYALQNRIDNLHLLILNLVFQVYFVQSKSIGSLLKRNETGGILGIFSKISFHTNSYLRTFLEKKSKSLNHYESIKFMQVVLGFFVLIVKWKWEKTLDWQSGFVSHQFGSLGWL